mgnify:CR=1 FL=1
MKIYVHEDHDIPLFEKILKNDCDEEFRFIQIHVKDTLLSLLKAIIKDKFPLKGEAEILRIIDSVQNGTIETWLWNKIIEKMYEINDQEELRQMFAKQIRYRA